MISESLQKSNILIYNQPDCILPRSFFEGRFVPNFHPESLDHEQWWNDQMHRCENGWKDGGFEVSPQYYYHLNFKEINMLDHNNRPTFDHPYFAYEDQQLFNDVTLARNSGKGLILITGRGFGKSFDAATLSEWEYAFVDASEIIVSASAALFADNLWQKVKLGINSMPGELRPTYLIERENYIESGLKETLDGKSQVTGYRSKIWKVVYDNKPGRTRGTRPNIHIFEEIGSWGGAAKLIQCYKATEASWWRGKFFTCFPLLIGTGGEMETGGSEDALTMFENPDAYNLMAYQYGDSPNGVIGKFVPAYHKLGGFYEIDGMNHEQDAKEFLDSRRENKKKDIQMYRQETMEFPYNYAEAFQVSGANNFNIPLLENRYVEIESTPSIKNRVQWGWLIPEMSGKKIIGVRWKQDSKNGIFGILEHPKLDNDGRPRKNQYISGCDSFDSVEEEADKSGQKSEGCIKIFKRFYNAEETGRIFVGTLRQRTPNATEFYWNTVYLNMYYGCQMLYEHTKIGIAQHYIMNNLFMYLYPRPRLDKIDVVKRPTATNTYGIVMPIQIKAHAINRYKEYLDQYTDQIYFPEQLLDAIRFRFGSSAHDETMAAAITLLGDDDMYNVEVREITKKSVHFPRFVRDATGNMVFK